MSSYGQFFPPNSTFKILDSQQYAGCSLIGDEKYGSTEINTAFRSKGCRRLFLHAARLDLVLPSGAPLTLSAALPEDLESCLRQLGASEVNL